MRQQKKYYVYILASQRNGTLYIGMTNNISRRMLEHKNEVNDGFSKRYHIHRLVHVEATRYVLNAYEREKQLKHWKRSWKIQLIEETNPEWKDLFDTLEE